MVPFILLALFAFVRVAQAIPIVYEESTGKVLQVGYANAKQFEGNPDIKTKEVPDAAVITAMRSVGGLADLKVVNGVVQQRSAKEVSDRKDAEKVRKIVELKLRLVTLEALQSKETDPTTLDVLETMIAEVTSEISGLNK